MKRKLVLLILSVLAMAGLTAWRVYQIGNCIDPFNGFFNAGYEWQRLAFAIAIIIFIIVVAIIAFTDKKFPGSPRRSSRALAFANLIYAAFIVVDSFAIATAVTTFWDVLYYILLYAYAAFMVYYAMCLFRCKKPSPIISIFPMLFFVYKLTLTFIFSFGRIKSTDVTLSIVSLVLCLLFFEFYARYISKTSFIKVRKVTLVTGICASVVSIATFLSDAIAPYFFEGITSRMATGNDLFMVITGIYIAVFLILSYSKRLLYRAYNESDHEVVYTSESINF